MTKLTLATAQDRVPERRTTFELHASKASILHVVFAAEMEFDTHKHEVPYLCFIVDGGYEEWSGPSHSAVGLGAQRTYRLSSRHAVRTGVDGVALLHVTDPLEREWDGEPTPGRLGLLWQIAAEVTHGGLVDDASSLHLDTLALELRGDCEADDATFDGLSKAASRLRDEPGSPITMSELARIAKTHPAHFARAFKRRYGMTAGEFVRRIRVATAVEKLRQPDCSIPQAAIEVGFFDQSHMCRWFRRYLGRTPSAIRDGSTGGRSS